MRFLIILSSAATQQLPIIGLNTILRATLLQLLGLTPTLILSVIGNDAIQRTNFRIPPLKRRRRIRGTATHGHTIRSHDADIAHGTDAFNGLVGSFVDVVVADICVRAAGEVASGFRADGSVAALKALGAGELALCQGYCVGRERRG